MRSYRIRGVPESDDLRMRRGHTGRRLCDNGGREGREIATGQAKPRTANSHQTPEGTRRPPLLEAFPVLEGTQPYQHLDFGLPAFKTVRGYISVFFFF